MALRPIKNCFDPVLRKQCEIVKNIDGELVTLSEDMIETTLAAPGVGLAANQIGISRRIFVVNMGMETDKDYLVTLINPEITAIEGSELGEEGCLSIPGVYLDVVRPTAIQLSFRDEMGRPRSMKADGLMARCIQHEMDHLKGVLFVDRVTDAGGLNKELQDHGFEAADVRSLV